MTSRTTVILSGSVTPSRRTVSMMEELAGPRIFSTASRSVSPCTGSPSRCEMRSPARMPALTAGVSSIGEITLMSSFSIVTSMPSP